jgi:hypothetical protein
MLNGGSCRYSCTDTDAPPNLRVVLRGRADRDGLAPSASQARHLPHSVREESEGISPLVPLGEMGRGTRARGGAENGHQQMSVHLSAEPLLHTAHFVIRAVHTPRSHPKSP